MAASLPQGMVSLSVFGAILKCRVGEGCEVGLSLHGALPEQEDGVLLGPVTVMPTLGFKFLYPCLSLSLGHGPGQQSQTSVVLGTCSGMAGFSSL